MLMTSPGDTGNEPETRPRGEETGMKTIPIGRFAVSTAVALALLAALLALPIAAIGTLAGSWG